METLEFIGNRYHFYIPLTFNKGILPFNTNIGSIIKIKCTINCLTPGIKYGSSTHKLILTKQENLRCQLHAIPLQTNMLESIDFHIAYFVQTNVISAALLTEKPNQYQYDPQGSFVCFINPPAQSNKLVPRDIIFLIDRSGSVCTFFNHFQKKKKIKNDRIMYKTN